MTEPERRAYVLIKMLTIAATALALACQTIRLLGILDRWPIAGVLFLPGIFAFLATPFLVIWGIGYSLVVRTRIVSREHEREGRPSLFMFLVCGLVWFFVCYTFKLVPLFVGETRVQRVFIDTWFDKLL